MHIKIMAFFLSLLRDPTVLSVCLSYCCELPFSAYCAFVKKLNLTVVTVVLPAVTRYDEEVIRECEVIRL